MNPIGRVVGAGLAGLLALAGCDVSDGGDTEATETSGASPDARMVKVFDLRVGQCIDGVAEARGRVELFAVVACDAAHDGEVYRVFDLEGDDEAGYPGSSEVDEAAARSCEETFEDYVGIPYQESRFQATFVAPSEETWAGGDREVVCFAYVPRGDLRRSIEGSAE